MASVEGGGRENDPKLLQLPALATQEKKSRIKKQHLKKTHGLLKTIMDYFEQTANEER